MENSDEDAQHLQFLSRTPSVGSAAEGVSPEPEQERRGSREESAPDPQPQTKRAEPKPRTDDPSLARVEFRIQQLQNRLLILQNAQEVKKKAEDGAESTDEQPPATCDPSDGGCELEAVQQELEELQLTKKKLEEQGKSSRATGQQKSYTAETPRWGIYTLPDLHLHQVKPTPTVDQIIPAERLGETSMLTRCPSCGEVICTDVHRKASEAMWLLCCMLSMLGCAAGCCLIPFFMESLKKVYHFCPNCQATIHIHRPF